MTGRWAQAGAVYFAGVFAAGFVLGTLRVLFLEDRIGPVLAVMAETPVMLAFAWFVAGLVARRFAVPSSAGPRVAMGILALALLLTAETLLAAALGTPVSAHFAGYLTARGAVTTFAQTIFAAIPWLRTITGVED